MKTPTLVLVFLILLSGRAFAQSSTRFTITRNVIAGGGTTASVSARFQLAGTIGQPVATVSNSSRFSIQGGFWIWPPPILFGPAKMGTNFLLSIQSEPGKAYTLQYANTLGSSWQSLPPITGNGNVITVTNAVANVAEKFYRLVEQ